jgi:hypothetical protein
MCAATMDGDGKIADEHVVVYSALVTMAIPLRGKEVTLQRPNGEMRCVRFKYTVIGGCVYVYIPAWLFELNKGHDANVQATIWKNVHDGVVRETYVVLTSPECRGTDAFRFRVLQGTEVPRHFRGPACRKFGVGHDRGLIVLYPR